MSNLPSRSEPTPERTALPADADEIPDWLKALKPDEVAAEADSMVAAEAAVASSDPPAARRPAAPESESISVNGLLGEDDLPAWLRALGEPTSEPAAPAVTPATTGAIPAWALTETPAAEVPVAAAEPLPSVWGQRPTRPSAEPIGGAAIFASLADAEVTEAPPAPEPVAMAPVSMDEPTRSGPPWGLIVLVAMALIIVLVLVGVMLMR